MKRMLIAVLAPLVFAAPAFAQKGEAAAAPTRALGEIVAAVDETCPAGLWAEMRTALGDSHPLEGEWLLMLADSYRFSECLDQAENIYSSLISNRYASRRAREQARVGLDRVLARR